ncbi:hypothetical protein ABT294_40810 [Nonomuraea sp. NPDC000554]|uniref:hypothetical protein n=1 Tax=Nonomuraea sp. NPDC000554 TaxID=3154259 RepID=UPI00332D18DF
MRERPLEMLLPAGFICAVGTCAVASLAFSETAARVAVMAAAVGLFGSWARRYLAALATGVMAWCFATGFLTHAKGELAFGPDDLLRLAAFTAVALAGCAWGHTRRVRRPYRLMRADLRRTPMLLRRLHGRANGVSRTDR